MFISDVSEDGLRLLTRGRVRAADRIAVEGEYRRRLLDALAKAKVELVTAQRIDVIGSAARMQRPRQRGRAGARDAEPVDGPQP